MAVVWGYLVNKKLWVVVTAAAVAVSLSQAQAADVPRKAPAAEAPAASLWTGCYVGVVAGGVLGSSQHTAAGGVDFGLPITSNFDESGGSAGGTIGCNYELQGWVLGAENDISWTNVRGSASDQRPFNLAAVSHTDQNWLDSIRGRVGVTWEHSLMSYVTAGGAFAGTTASVCLPSLGECASQQNIRSGWIAGLGVEYGVWSNLYLKLEYLHADLGGAGRYFNTPTPIGALTVTTRDVSLKDDLLRVGLNWRFTMLP
jgi:outer membrane immunogenic protein